MHKARQLIRTAHSCAEDPRQAVREFHAAVRQPEMELVVFFCSSDYDLDALADEMNRLFAGIGVVGCTTAGEIGPAGYITRSLTGASLPRGAFSAAAGYLGSLHEFELSRGQAFARSLLQQLASRQETAGTDNSFALLLIDGLSIREEAVTHTFQHALGQIPLVGGSAGDDLKFSRTHVFHGGAFHSDAAVLALVSTVYPFKIFKTQHFTSESERLVVTRVDAAHRLVYEINGQPAAYEYARLIGKPVQALTPACFAAAPVVVLIDGTDYVRSIQKANPDGSLTFYCAIEEGLVLRVARGENLVANLEKTFARLNEEIGQPQFVFASDCILRHLETAQKGLNDSVADIFRRNNAVGFSTYGEQFCGTHVNQTLTGVAIGSTARSSTGRRPTQGREPAENGSLTEGPMASDKAAVFALSEGEHGNANNESALRAEIARQNKIITALMNRAERAMGSHASDFGLFQTAILLENEVQARTRELEAAELENQRINRDLQRANRELEAFSYSVAHDLRAPLRAIDGFSDLLQRHNAEQLDASGRDNLARVREGAQRMRQLIDDLLELSRCSRASLVREAVDLAALARRIVAGLRESEPARPVEFAVPDHLPAEGDPRLLTVLLENLLGNAWKYSRQRDPAHIAFGFDAGSAAYFVRDDGAGFDMAYAGKLFQVFQRLHSAAEFEGTGIGLAIVQRIVERHGGRIWAEAEAGRGATFFFTLAERSMPTALAEALPRLAA